MSKPYKKKVLTYKQQIDQLERRGMKFSSKEKSEHLLSVISYYRLSGYWYPLLEDKKKHIFKPNAKFETAFDLYKFDRELRQLINCELEKIEVAIRAKMIYHLSHGLNSNWYTESSNFRNHNQHSKTLEKIESELLRSDEEFIQEFKKNYSDKYPPCWMTFEITSFGTLSMLYSSLSLGKLKREVAASFGLSDIVFQSWIHSIVYLRNVCAHHSRLWNRDLRIQPVRPRNTKNSWLTNQHIRNDKTFFVLSMLLYLLNTINPSHTFVSRLKDLLAKYPNSDIKAMGFPIDWEEEAIWQVSR